MASVTVGQLRNHENVVSWLNENLGSSKPASDSLVVLEQQIASLLAALEVASQDATADVEHIIDQVTNGIPRLTYDLHFMRDGAVSLQSALSLVQADTTTTVPKNVDEALDKLQHLDLIKNRMEAAREVLREAESWSSLEMEVIGLLAERNYEKTAERLSEASKSMTVFANTAEYESRRTLMVSLQNQLEASLSSALVAAVASSDVPQCRQYYLIFSNIQRELEYRNYYYATVRKTLTSLWTDAKIADCDGPEAGQEYASFSSFLSTWFSSFLGLLNQQKVSITAIFPDPASSLSALVTSVLGALQPTFSQRLSSLASFHGPAAISQLIDVFKATKEFAIHAERVFEKISVSTISPALKSPLVPQDGSTSPEISTAKGHHRKRSSRMSISMRASSGRLATPHSSTLVELEWDQDLLRPFVDFQTEYTNLEKRYLDSALNIIVSSETIEPSADRARILRERTVDLFGVVDDCLGRCLTFTHGYGAVGLVQASDHFLRSFIDLWTADISSSWSAMSSSKSTTATSELSDLDYTPEDWTSIQVSLNLLSSSRSFLERLSNFEDKLRNNLLQIAVQLRLGYQDTQILASSGLSHAENLLLMQSSLNSAELHDFLKVIEDDKNSNNPQLCTNARLAVHEFAGATQLALQTTILSPLLKHLKSYPLSPIWSAPAPVNLVSRVKDLPTFSLDQTSAANNLAEGMLNLPRLFEVYAGDDALSFSLQTLPFVDAELLRQQSDTAPSSEAIGHKRRPSLAHKSSSQPQQIHLSTEVIASTWLTSLVRSIFSHLTEEVLPQIASLSEHGTAQLKSDLAYLSNILSALGTEWPPLQSWRHYLSAKEDEFINKSGSRDPVMAQVARMRGISVRNN